MKLVLLLLTFSSIISANSGTDLLLKNNNGKLFNSPIVKQHKQMILDNAFLVQLYGSFKAANISNDDIVAYFAGIFDKRYSNSLKVSNQLITKYPKYRNLLVSSKLFLLWETGLNQTFFNSWLNEAAKYSFLKSELGISLDQYISNGASRWIVANGISLTRDQRSLVSKIEKSESNFNYSIQAIASMGQGLKSLQRIAYLQKSDELIIPLAKSSVIHFARNNELAKAAKVLKDLYEPVVDSRDKMEEISDYYLTLARLLYQAKAYDAAQSYYELIPDESHNFLTAKVESLWLSMRNDDLPTLKGHIKSLEFELFKKEFMPEVFLVSSMASLQTCQFDRVKRSFEKFLAVNKPIAKEIAESLNMQEPKLIKENFQTRHLLNSIKETHAEIDTLLQIAGSNTWKQEIVHLENKEDELRESKKSMAKLQWSNRQKLLELAIKNMRFVKIEYLSTMRRLKSKLALMRKEDSISVRQAARSKVNQVKFPYDGVVFGDELFNYSSEIKNLCLKGKR